MIMSGASVRTGGKSGASLKRAHAVYLAFRCARFCNSSGLSDRTVRGGAARLRPDGVTVPELAKPLKSAPRPEERAIPTDEVPKLLGTGWTFVAPLNGSMAVLRAPAQ